MSMQDYIHIGVFVECVNLKVEKFSEIKSCGNQACGNYLKMSLDMFCRWCGTPIGVHHVSASAEQVDKWEVSSQIDEALSCCIVEGSVNDIWIPNHGGGVEIDTENVSALELSPHMRSLHLDTFGTLYADALAGLIRAYGEDSVTVKWGVVKYTM